MADCETALALHLCICVCVRMYVCVHVHTQSTLDRPTLMGPLWSNQGGNRINWRKICILVKPLNFIELSYKIELTEVELTSQLYMCGYVYMYIHINFLWLEMVL